MNAALAIPGLVRRIVLDVDWQDAPLVLADALEEIGECRAATLLRRRHQGLLNRLNALASERKGIMSRSEFNARHWAIEVFKLYVARRFAPELVPGLREPSATLELRILPDPAGVQPAT